MVLVAGIIGSEMPASASAASSLTGPPNHLHRMEIAQANPAGDGSPERGVAAGILGSNLSTEEVERVQEALKAHGLDVEVNGVWRDGTARALVRYQEDRGLPPSGELDAATIESLGVSLKDGSGAADQPSPLDLLPPSPRTP